jgi:hypothetical protein
VVSAQHQGGHHIDAPDVRDRPKYREVEFMTGTRSAAAQCQHPSSLLPPDAPGPRPG